MNDYQVSTERYKELIAKEETLAKLKSEIKRLDKREMKLDALEAAGVDNWCGYEDAMEILDEM